MFFTRLAAQTNKMKQIPRSDRLPERQKMACLALSRLPALSRRNRLLFWPNKTPFFANVQRGVPGIEIDVCHTAVITS